MSHSFDKRFLNAYYVSGTVLGAGNTFVKRTEKVFVIMKFISHRKDKNKCGID